jgi:hypothetical protein
VTVQAGQRSGVILRSVRTAALALAVATVAAACTGSGDATTASPSTSAAPAKIVFRVSGEVPIADVQWGMRRSPTKRRVQLPWQKTMSVPVGSTMALRADQLPSANGYRLQCSITATIAGHEPFVARDSSHIVATKEGGAPRKIQYDGQCLARLEVSLTGL